MKKFALIPVALLGALLLASCSTMSVKTDYGHDADFSRYRTFGRISQPGKPDPRGAVDNSLMVSRIKKAITREMEAKGYSMADGGRADLRIAFHLNVRNQVEVDHYGYGYRHRHVRTEVHHYKEGTFMIDLVDPKMQQLVWRGWASAAIARPENSDEQINEAVHKILEKYPPNQ